MKFHLCHNPLVMLMEDDGLIPELSHYFVLFGSETKFELV